MQESPPADVAANDAGHRPEALSPETIEAVLADFRGWLQQAAVEPSPPPPAEGEQPIDLHTLLSQFVALRHEVNLQTRATRTQQEQNSQTLQQLEQALEILRQSEAAEQQARQQADDEKVRPLLKTLIDLHDALSLARRELQRSQEAMSAAAEQYTMPGEPIPDLPPVPDLAGPPPPAPPRPSFWSRWFGSGEPDRPTDGVPEPEALADLQRTLTAQHEVVASWRQRLLAREEHSRQTGQALERLSDFLDSLIIGYTMSVQRVERALHEHDLEPIAAVGEPFDPERMEVLEVVGNSGRPSGEVVGEVRRGYLWRGRVFRYAQVRVAKS
jgi:molecular chaperone GrpE